MTKLLITATMLLSGTAFAADNMISYSEISRLKSLTNIKVIVDLPSPMLAVQPTGFVTFSYSSCAKREFVADVEQESGVMIVKIVDESNRDCRGPAVERKYNVQISSDMHPMARVTVLNPTQPLVK